MKEKTDKEHVKKPFYKKWWFWVIIVVLLAAVIGNTGNDDKEQNNVSATDESKENQSDNVSADKFVEEVRTAIQGAINSENESIQDVVLKDGDLRVYVDFSNADPSPLTLEDLAWGRTGSITEAILILEEYDDLWETITVDFGDVGHITNKKEDIQRNMAGRYFPAENFQLEH